MPNVIDFLDECTVSFLPGIKAQTQNLFVFNDGVTLWNSDYYFGIYKNRNILRGNVSYKYMGFDHNVKKGTTKHYMIEN